MEQVGCKSREPEAPKNQAVGSPEAGDLNTRDPNYAPIALSKSEADDEMREPWAMMFYPPKIPQRQWNGNGMGFQRVPIENPLNADVAPVADPFF